MAHYLLRIIRQKTYQPARFDGFSISTKPLPSARTSSNLYIRRKEEKKKKEEKNTKKNENQKYNSIVDISPYIKD